MYRDVRMSELIEANPTLEQQLRDWQTERHRRGENAFDWQAFRSVVTYMGACDPGSEPPAEFFWFTPPEHASVIVHEVEGESGPEHLVCELVAYLPPGAVARAYLARAGYAFRVADACVCLLFDAASMPAFLTTDDGKATFECSLDGKKFSACTSPLKVKVKKKKAKHSLAVRAVDGNGNKSDEETYDWKVKPKKKKK